MQRVPLLCLPFLVSCVAEPSDRSANDAETERVADVATEAAPNQLLQDQPLGASDVAILLPMDDAVVIAASDRPGGTALLARSWIEEVAAAFARTSVGDAFELENYYEDWRLVSLRVSPCAPLGVFPGHEPDALCWPQVRLVWQPVLADLDVGWTIFDFYGDDRAIHTLYDWSSANAPTGLAMARAIRSTLASGGSSTNLPAELRADFEAARDVAAGEVITELLALRGALSADAWDALDLRPELLASADEAAAFGTRLRAWLGIRAQPQRLTELTSFSLPAGRVPALLDQWAFIAFTANDGVLSQRDLEIRSRQTGAVLAALPGAQVVDTSAEDPRLVDALAGAAGSELAEQVIFSPADAARLGDTITDPRQTLIPNTSCASCHRFGQLRFDFHNLSHLEEREHTISPRVNRDVERDLDWLMDWQARQE